MIANVVGIEENDGGMQSEPEMQSINVDRGLSR
jgi:hypothetical protein